MLAPVRMRFIYETQTLLYKQGCKSSASKVVYPTLAGEEVPLHVLCESPQSLEKVGTARLKAL